MDVIDVAKKWEKQIDPNNKYVGAFILGDRNVEVPPNAVVSVTRGEQFNIPRLIINGFLNQMIMKALSKNENLLYAELKGQLEGGVGQTMTVWKAGKDMNSFRTSGMHNFARKFFSWVFYSGKVQSYFFTWKVEGPIPTYEEATEIVTSIGRHFDGGKLVTKVKQPRDINKKPS
jgi:hypothetical protein